MTRQYSIAFYNTVECEKKYNTRTQNIKGTRLPLNSPKATLVKGVIMSLALHY